MPATIIADPVQCDLCGERVSDTRSLNGQEVCPVCIDEYPRCGRCDRYATRTLETVDGEDVCVNCARCHDDECQRCELLTDQVQTTAYGNDICSSCALDYWSCDGCGELINCGDYCSSCEDYYDDDDLSAGGLINDYSYKPAPRFHGNGPLFLGLELEVNAPRGEIEDCAELAQCTMGDLGYLKEDCSINGDTGYGFEIVTHPMAYEWAMVNFPWHMLANLERHDCTATGNGLHVHISRAAFDSAGHVYRWMKFLHRNVRQVTTVARRVSDQWAPFNETDRKQIKDYAKGAKGYRYQAINTQNDNTFELRVFASSLYQQEVKASLGLAAASVEYTQHLGIPDIVHGHGWEWSAFVAWLRERPAYAPLVRELEDRSCVC